MGYKIVRDNAEKIARAMEVSGHWRKSSDPLTGLTRKLFEEASEFAEYRDPGELYDLRDVVDELIYRLDSDGAYSGLHRAKVAVHGVFTEGIEWSPVPGGED